MNGIINLLKPPGISSHQAVGFVRRVLRTRKVGHTGTLDPGAAGVLPICVGKGTKLVPFLIEKDKRYIGEMTLGISTTSQDAIGETVKINTDFAISPQRLADTLADFTGSISQLPPMTSAVRVQGKKLYEYARAGEEVDRAERRAIIHSLHINKVWPEGSVTDPITFGARILLDVTCSKGTYIRTLFHDIGEALGVGAHMSFLTRVSSGPFSIQDSFTIEEIENRAKRKDLSFLLPLSEGLPDWARVKVSPLAEERILHGNFVYPDEFLEVPTELVPGDQIILQDLAGEVLALAELIVREGSLVCQPTRVIKEGT